MSSSMQPFGSPRHLVFRHGKKLLRSRQGEGEDPKPLGPGEELLHSFYLPGLQTGPQTISVVQTIQAGAVTKNLSSQQQFNVVGPRFSLPDKAIHSVYPPQGHQDMVECLPHVVFKDPTFPWERVGSYNAEKMKPQPPDYNRNRTPWLAVLTFTRDELMLPKTALDPKTGIFTNVHGLEKGPVQGPTFSINMPVSQITNIQKTASPVVYDQSTDGDATSDMLLLPRNLFTSLFSQYDKDGNPNSAAPYVYHHRYLAHRRDINSEGISVTNASNGDDSAGSFGVIFSHRSGPVDISEPTPVYVHLVSIEGIEQMKPWPVPEATPYVAVSSLYSWSYLCLPPNTPTIRDEFVTLGKSTSLLSPTLDPKKLALFVSKPGGSIISDRLKAGYSLSRYRVQTGEQTACLVRGPFVPTQDPPAQDWWPSTSMTGTDLQILDQEVGIMDISYSAAWQLGRTMAIADQAFVAALGNVRGYISDHSRDSAQASALRQLGLYKSKEDLLASISHTVQRLQHLHLEDTLAQPRSTLSRWFRPPKPSQNLTYQGDALAPFLADAIPQAALDVSSTPKVRDPTQPSDIPYDEYNTPFSADWVLVLRWVLDRLFFDSIPAHYLITDASHVPPESLKFFRIDTRWTDSMIDGALSLGNHYYQQSDPQRDAIKAAIKRYMTTPNSVLKYVPPIPQYGCFIRSAIITKFPDIIVSIEPAPAVTEAPVLLRHQVLDEGTMLCLFSEMPSSTTWKTLTFTQPPHQQTFMAADHITGPTAQTITTESGSSTVPANTITMEYKRAYTIPDPSTADPKHSSPLTGTYSWTMDATGTSPMYAWTQSDPSTNKSYDVRTLLMDNLAPDYLAQLQSQMDKKFFNDNIATSALMAWQQNIPSYSLTIQSNKSTLAFTPEPRSLPTSQPKTPEKPSVQKRSSIGSSLMAKPSEQDSSAARSNEQPEHSYPVLTVAPHHKTFRAIPFTPNLSPETDGALFPTHPVFRYTFSPVLAPVAPPNQGQIPMAGPPQDIIFSINLQNQPGSYLLTEIDISVPFGDPPTPEQPGPIYTLTNKAPTGTFMLSNLRFNPVLVRSDDTKSLVIRLMPRSTQGYVAAASCHELNFVLTGVRVNESTMQPYNVELSVTETYENTQVFKSTPLMSIVPRITGS